jgi:hypothetical protein
MYEHLETRNSKEVVSIEQQVLCAYENRKPEEE